MLRLQIGAASAAVLVLGLWLAPRTPPTALSTPQERAVPMLEEQVHDRAAADLARSVREVVRGAADYSVSFDVSEPAARTVRRDFESTARPIVRAAFGVRVSDTRLLTHLDALRSPTAVRGRSADGTPFEARVTAFEAATGLVLLETRPTTVAPAPMSPLGVAPGALVVGAAQSGSGVFAAPVFVEAVDGSGFTTGAPVLPAGLPLFDLEGRLVAVAGGRAGIAFAASAAVERLVARAGAGERSSGLSLQDREGLLEKALGPKGVVVSDVVANGPADRAGLKSGDLLLTLGAGDIDTAAEAMQALADAHGRADPVVLTVRAPDERRPRTIAMVPASTVAIAALARERRAVERGVEAGAVFDSGPLEAAGVPASARLVSVNGAIVESRDDVRRALRRRPMPAILVLSDERGRYVTAIEVPR